MANNQDNLGLVAIQKTALYVVLLFTTCTTLPASWAEIAGAPPI